MANIPGYAAGMVRGDDTNPNIRGFQVRDNSGLVVGGNQTIQSTRPLVDIAAVAPTMAGPAVTTKKTPTSGFLGALKLGVPIGFEVG